LVKVAHKGKKKSNLGGYPLNNLLLILSVSLCTCENVFYNMKLDLSLIMEKVMSHTRILSLAIALSLSPY